MESGNGKCRILPKRPLLTPETVPKFVIPGSTVSPKTQVDSPPPFKHCTAYGRRSPSESPLTNDPPTSPLASSLRVRLDNYRQLGRQSSALLLKRPNSIEEHSDSDPGYKLAMSLRHMPKTASAYGFVSLSGNPRTTRKESLFFPRGSKVASSRLRSRNSAGLLCSEISDTSADSSSPIPPQIKSRRFSRCRDPVELSNDESEDDNLVTSERKRRWAKASKKRRNGIRLPSQTGRQEQDVYDSSDADHSALEDSPDLRKNRRSKQLTLRETEAIKETNRAFALQQLHLRCARQRQTVSDLGGLEVALRYDVPSKRLWVLLIRGENLDQGNGLSPKQVCSFVKLQIRSEQSNKCQTQTSATVRNTCDPFYDEEFAFENFGRGNIKSARLRLKVCRERRGMPSASVGEIWLDLLQLEQNGFMHCQEDLKPKHLFKRKDPKKLHIALSYRPNTRCLTAVVVKTQNVHSLSFVKGYRVEVELTQVSPDGSSLVTETAQTRLRHGFSTSPVFKEAFSFCLNETRNIRDGLTLVCRVIQTETCGRRCSPIGLVRFGVGSTQKSEMDQWQTLLRRLGRQTTQWHALVPA
ncbi:C2 calcium-dependent domain-containing protein 4C-like [Patiria miniata]|uniref:C2 domain-containing protein n=1 Tax=Patiria miniata TaxID=46514 RepID=A0A914BJJ3_PATMI|nr:C2 calcium-dependent domain-containing protein 4C-like [Patiria miniata]